MNGTGNGAGRAGNAQIDRLVTDVFQVVEKGRPGVHQVMG